MIGKANSRYESIFVDTPEQWSGKCLEMFHFNGQARENLKPTQWQPINIGFTFKYKLLLKNVLYEWTAIIIKDILYSDYCEINIYENFCMFCRQIKMVFT